MTENGMSPADLSAVLGNRADGMFGGEGGWVWLLIILFAIGGGNFGFNGNGYNLANEIDSRFISRDIFSTNQNVSATSAGTNANVSETKYDLGTQILDNKYATQLAVANASAQSSQCCCEVKQAIAQNNYNNALQTQTLSSQIYQEACANRELDTANTQKILDKLCSMQVDTLQTRLSEKEAEIRELQLENSQAALAQSIVDQIRPTASPAWVVASPYQSIYNPYSTGCGCGYSTLV